MGSRMVKSAVLVSAGLTGLVWSSSATGLARAGIAQPTEACRQTNALTGVYVQPSLESSSRGILASGQTVRLEVNGAGTGWARVTEPLIGWVEAKYLTPAACSGFSTAATQPVAQPTAIQPASAITITATCDVLPAEGLIVRSEPTTTGGTALQTLPKGTYQFQFSRDRVRSHAGEVERDWVYITAPYQGWIAIGVVGGQFNLGGQTCG